MANIPSPVQAGVAPQKRPGAGEQLLIALASQAPGILFDVLKYRTEQGQTGAANQAAQQGVAALYQQHPEWFPQGFNPASVDPRGSATLLEQLRTNAATTAQIGQAEAATAASRASAAESGARTGLIGEQTTTERATRPNLLAAGKANAKLLQVQTAFEEKTLPVRERALQLQNDLVLAQTAAQRSGSARDAAEIRRIEAEIRKLDGERSTRLNEQIENVYQTEQERVQGLTELFVGMGRPAGEARRLALQTQYEGATTPQEIRQMIRARLEGNEDLLTATRNSIVRRLGLPVEKVEYLDEKYRKAGGAQAAFEELREEGLSQEQLEEAAVFYATAYGETIEVKTEPRWWKKLFNPTADKPVSEMTPAERKQMLLNVATGSGRAVLAGAASAGGAVKKTAELVGRTVR